MFDTFFILVPELSQDVHLEIRLEQAASGSNVARRVFFDGQAFAQIATARDWFTNVEAWTGSAARGGWTVLSASDAANRAITSDDTWAEFLRRLSVVLGAHKTWMVICESDCDQDPIEELDLSPEELSQFLDSYRTEGGPIAIRASSLCSSP